MLKLTTTAAFALILSAAPALAKGPKAKVFAGNYNGVSKIDNAVGDSIFFTLSVIETF